MDQIALDPRGIRRHFDVGGLDALAATIKGLGVLQPVTACTADAYNAAAGRIVIDDATVRWVILFGIRRTLAARLAGCDFVPAIVDDERAPGRLMHQLVENLARDPLSPIDEALRYQELVDAGDSQRQIAGGAGVSAMTVNRRLRLLRLPSTIIDAIDDGTLRTRDGDTIAEAFDGDPAAALSAFLRMAGDGGASLTAEAAVAEELAAQAFAAAADASRKTLADLGLQPIDPNALWGDAAVEHLIDPELGLSLAQRRSAHPTCLAAAVDEQDGSIVWYCTDPSLHAVDDPEERIRSQAGTSRAATCLSLIGRPPTISRDETFTRVTDLGVIRSATPAVLRLACKWADILGWLPPSCDGRRGAYADFILSLDPSDQRVHRFATTVTLASNELHARRRDTDTHAGWDDRDRTYLAALVTQAGYTPTPWEQARLAAGEEPEPDDDDRDVA